MTRPVIPLIFTLALLLAACSPALNWRSVPVEGAPLTVLLPCKPEQAARPVEFPGLGPVELSLMGCKADGATFAVSHLRVADAARAGAVLAQWRTAVLARMQADAAAAQDAPFTLSGALALPQSVRSRMAGRAADGAAVAAQGVWFAQLDGGGARLYHAVVYADNAQRLSAMGDTFFGGLQLQEAR